MPQASGSAVGAGYDSKGATLTLESNIVVHSTDESATTITARHGVITKGPNRAVLDGVHVARDTGSFASNQLTVYLRDDNTIERMLATGDVRADTKGKSATEVRSPRAEAWITAKNALTAAEFSGDVQLNSTGEQAMQGTAGKVTVSLRGAEPSPTKSLPATASSCCSNRLAAKRRIRWRSPRQPSTFC